MFVRAGYGFSGLAWIPELPPSLEQFLAPNFQPIPVIPVIAIGIGLLYLIGAVQQWAASRRWSVVRTVCFLAGCALTAVTMGAGIEGYGYVLLSVFIFQQLTLMMAIPVLLVLGSPGTLLLRSVPHRGIGKLVLRASLGLLRSALMRFLIHPVVMIPLFLAAFYGLYFTEAASWLLATWGGHLSLELFFLVSGLLFTAPLISSDPLPRRQSHLGKLLDVFAEMPLHAFFGVIMMSAPAVMVKYFDSTSPQWGIDPVKDQQIAGGLAWSYGELPSVIMLLVLLIRWEKDDTRNAKRASRAADLYGDAEFDAYNQQLERLNRRGSSQR
jgi:putative membrane protein